MQTRQKPVVGRGQQRRRKTSDHRSHKASGIMVPRERHVSPEESRDLLDRKSRDYFQVSGDEFSRLYRAGVYNVNHPKVASLGVLVTVIDSE